MICIRLYDVVALRMVRKFEGHTDCITDLCFCEDGKWLLSSSMDGSLRIWDVVLARQIDAIHVDVSVTALSLSPNMDVLATSHVDQNGVYLWFATNPLNLPKNLRRLLSSCLQFHLFLDKPCESNGDNNAKGNEVEENDRKLDMPPSPFSQLIQSSAERKNLSAFTDYIKGLSPSALDMELRMLQIIDDENQQELDRRPEMISIELLLDYFIYRISYRNNFEFIQAVIRLFLKIHDEIIGCHSKLQDKATKLLEIQSDVWQRIDTLFQRTRCMVSFLSNSQF
ncbi:hypothetical protein REPUB_Repub03eG0147200 [Reevesia pubescens]